jgi:AAA family ATP:ADP antiporter
MLEFSKWRSFLWPVHRRELAKLIPMLLIFFFISFDYNVLRTLKDTLLVTAKSSGAEVIPFVKVWAMFPGAILMTLLYTRLSNYFSRESVFYIMLSLFLSYFFIFTFILYPARDILHPHQLADTLQTTLPEGFKGLIAMFRYWTFTLFYVMSELWSSVILSVLFWGFANQVTRLDEAKRFYGLFGIGANISGVAAGQISVYFCRQEFNPSLPFGADAWEQSLISLISLILIAGIASIALFRWLNNHIRMQSSSLNQESAKEEVVGRLSFRENFRYLLRSKYLFCIAAIVVAYNIVINLVEVVWKHQVREMYPDPNEYSVYMNQIVTIVGVIATLTALLVSGNSIRKCGWTFTAILTPAILLVTSVGFFGTFFLKESAPNIAMALLGSSAPLALVVFWGSAQNILSRAAKYTVFDATKEMAFVPLNPEAKLMGKAAIDGVCSRLGKSGGAFIHQTLLLLFSTITASAPYVAASLLVVIVLWTAAVRMLGKQFVALTTSPQDERTIILEQKATLVTAPVNGLQGQQAVG